MGCTSRQSWSQPENKETVLVIRVVCSRTRLAVIRESLQMPLATTSSVSFPYQQQLASGDFIHACARKPEYYHIRAHLLVISIWEIRVVNVVIQKDWSRPENFRAARRPSFLAVALRSRMRFELEAVRWHQPAIVGLLRGSPAAHNKCQRPTS